MSVVYTEVSAYLTYLTVTGRIHTFGLLCPSGGPVSDYLLNTVCSFISISLTSVFWIPVKIFKTSAFQKWWCYRLYQACGPTNWKECSYELKEEIRIVFIGNKKRKNSSRIPRGVWNGWLWVLNPVLIASKQSTRIAYCSVAAYHSCLCGFKMTTWNSGFWASSSTCRVMENWGILENTLVNLHYNSLNLRNLVGCGCTSF